MLSLNRSVNMDIILTVKKYSLFKLLKVSFHHIYTVTTKRLKDLEESLFFYLQFVCIFRGYRETFGD